MDSGIVPSVDTRAAIRDFARMSFTLTPLGSFGREVFGLDLARPMADDVFATLAATFFENQLLVFRGQTLTAPQFHAFARRFGPPEPHVIDQFHHRDIADILILS